MYFLEIKAMATLSNYSHNNHVARKYESKTRHWPACKNTQGNRQNINMESFERGKGMVALSYTDLIVKIKKKNLQNWD